MKSIRRHLTRWLLLGIAALIIVAGTACHRLVGTLLLDRLDRALVAKARTLGALVEREVFGMEFAFSDDLMPEFSRTERPEFFQIWLDDGKELARSRRLGNESLPRLAGPPDRPVLHDIVLPDGRSGRAAGVRLPVADRDYRVVDGGEDLLREARRRLGVTESDHVTILCAAGTEDVREALAALLAGLVTAGVALLGGAALLVRIVVAAGCRPVRDMAERIERLAPETASPADLDGPCPAELAPIRSSFQACFRRLLESMARERRIVSDIAHELRTPVAELRTVTELARRWRDDRELGDKSLDEAHQIALQMDRLLRTCLRMARLESGQAAVENRPVVLDDLLSALSAQAATVAHERGLTLDPEIAPRCTIRSDPELLELILANLLDNSVRHAPEGTTVRISSSRDNGTVEVLLSNPAPDLTAEDVSRVGEPFWRKEAARSDDRHLGLGVAMVASAARAIGADLGLAVVDGCFEARLRLRAEPAPEDALSRS